MICFTFPGQGSQRAHMGHPWRDDPAWSVVDEVADATGRDIAHLLLDASDDELRSTANAQLATFSASLVALEAVGRAGVTPDAVAGHSLGEYTALVAAGAVGRADAARLVAARGQAMGRATDAVAGTMAAVLGLDRDAVSSACDGLDAWVANDNAPGQVVIGGTTRAVAAAGDAARQAGARKVLALQVGGAFHTPLMAPASAALEAALDVTALDHARIPVVANIDGRPHRRPHDWRRLLAAQLCSPVEWQSCLHGLADLGADLVVELGAGTTLTGLTRRVLPAVATAAIGAPADVVEMAEEAHRHRGGGPDGEHPHADERVIVSPAAGVFTPEGDLTPGRTLHTGQTVGTVGATPVHSPFSGRVAGTLARDGERLTLAQPVAWLRGATP